MNTKTICLICARGGSKGVPKKNIRPLAGKPLIAYSIEIALRTEFFSDVIVSTDDPEIAEISAHYGATVPFMRPSQMASDTAEKLDAMHYTVTRLANEGMEFEFVIDKDPTVPFIDRHDIARCMDALKSPDCDTAVGVTEPHINPYFNMVEIGANGFLDISKNPSSPMVSRYLRRQDCPPVYNMHGLIGLKKNIFIEQRKVYSTRTLPIICPPMHSIMIDYEIDFQFCEFLLAQRLVLNEDR